MFQAIKNWYNLYTPGQFVLHKSFHLAVGFISSGIISMLTGHVSLGLATALVLGVLKEVYDHSQAAVGADAPISAHILDIIVTTSGGCLVLFISQIF